MKKVILEFTLNGRKHVYFKRLDMYNNPVTTNNINNARKVKESLTPGIIKRLIEIYGKNNVSDVNMIEQE